MLAVDQRESLRAMMAQARGADVSDEELVAFKSAATEILTPLSSAVLLDEQYALRDGPPPIAAHCALILAADDFQQQPGGIVEASDVNPHLTADRIRALGADALKLLVLWSPGSGRDQRTDIVGRFNELASAAGVPTVLEGIVRPSSGQQWPSSDERDEAILAAAAEFAESKPDLYKAEVPGLGLLAPEVLAAKAQGITQVLDCPWVVLSSGVPAEVFPLAVEAACTGGASGFLAGRAVWRESLSAGDVRHSLQTVAVQRLSALNAVVAATVPTSNPPGQL
jgi:sulfofructosephosphate aldolase